MKPRDAEALRLEESYLQRVREALAGRPEPEIVEILQSIREHIDESISAPMITLGLIAAVIERLGPPAVYAGEAHATAAAAPSAAVPPAPAMPAVPALEKRDLVHVAFDIGTVLNDAVSLFGRHYLRLILASLIFNVLAICSLGILYGALTAGIALMLFPIIENPAASVDLGAMFRGFNRLLGLFLLSLLCVPLEFIGMAMCVIPGILLITVWNYAPILMVDRGMGVIESLRASYQMTTAPGRFVPNFVLTLIMVGSIYLAGAIPYIGTFIALAIAPFGWFIWVLAYVRQTQGSVPEQAAPMVPASAAL